MVDEQFKLADFGFAKFQRASEATEDRVKSKLEGGTQEYSMQIRSTVF